MKVEHNPATPHQLTPHYVVTMTKEEGDEIRRAVSSAINHGAHRSPEQRQVWLRFVEGMLGLGS